MAGCRHAASVPSEVSLGGLKFGGVTISTCNATYSIARTRHWTAERFASSKPVGAQGRQFVVTEIGCLRAGRRRFSAWSAVDAAQMSEKSCAPPADGQGCEPRGRSRLGAVDAERIDDESPGNTIAGVLREEILSGRRVGGERLVEEAIAKTFGVSRVPVREALAQLEAEGFVTIVRYRGATVSTTLRKDNRELLEVRHGLEVLAAQLAARNKGGTVAADLLLVVDAARGGSDNKASRSNGHSFHDLIAIASGNDQLREMLAGVNRRVAWGLGDDPDASVGDHAALAAAILSGAPVQAGYLMDEHLRRDEMGAEDGPGRQ